MMRMKLTILVLAASSFLAAASESQTAKIFGRVTVLPTGDPAPRAEVSIYGISYQGSSPIQITLLKTRATDDKGEYQFAGLEPGHYLIQAWTPGFATAKAWDIYVSGGLQRVVDIGMNVGGHSGEPVELAGEVKSANRELVPDATVTAIQFENPSNAFQTRTDRHGRYRLSVIYGGNYAVEVQKPDFQPQFRVADIHRKIVMDFELKPK